MSSPLFANCSRDSTRAGFGIGPVAQVETEKPVGIGMEVMCSQFEVIGPVVEVDSVQVVVGPVLEARGPVVALIRVETTEELSLVVQAVTVNVSVVEVIGPACELAGPWLKMGSVDEVRCSVVESVFFAILTVSSVIRVGPVGLVGLASEVTVSVVESIGPVVKATDPVLDIRESTLTTLWLNSTELMGYAVSGLITGMTGDVGSGLVPGLRGYGVSNRLPTEGQKDRCKQQNLWER